MTADGLFKLKAFNNRTSARQCLFQSSSCFLDGCEIIVTIRLPSLRSAKFQRGNMPSHAHESLKSENFTAHLMDRLERFASISHHSNSWPTFQPIIQRMIDTELVPVLADVICHHNDEYRHLEINGRPFHTSDPITTEDNDLIPVLVRSIQKWTIAIGRDCDNKLCRKKRTNCLIVLRNFQKKIRFC